MVRFLKVAILAPLSRLSFSVSLSPTIRRVIVSFDPFASDDNAALSIAAPLFAVVIVAAMLGVVAGAFATWLSQGRHRRASRQSRVEADKWRAQAQALKADHPALPSDR